MEINMKEIIVLVGLPGSGKDTWALEQMKKYPGRYKRITKDLIREMVDNSEFSVNNEKITLEIRDDIVKKLLYKGYSVILSDTNFPVGGKHYKRMCEIAKLVGDVRVWEKFFDIDIKECKRRNSNRLRVVPEHVIDNMYNKYINNKDFVLGDTYYPIVEKIKYNSNLPDCVIFDIDGTLAHALDRSMYDWSRVGEDKVDKYIRKINQIISKEKNNIKIFIFSGRDSICSSQTIDWLKSNEINYHSILMRAEGNSEKDSIIKERMYNEFIRDKYNVISIFDDRNQVVEMWRSLGLTVCQVAYGDF